MPLKAASIEAFGALVEERLEAATCFPTGPVLKNICSALDAIVNPSQEEHRTLQSYKRHIDTIKNLVDQPELYVEGEAAADREKLKKIALAKIAEKITELKGTLGRYAPPIRSVLILFIFEKQLWTCKGTIAEKS